MTHFLSPDFAKQRDFTKRWYPDPLALDISNPKCDYCEAIEFDKLPGEEEAAVPHQPSYAALKRSAERCALCTLLCDAIIEVRKSLDARNRLSTRGGATEFQPKVIVPNGTKVMGHFQMGGYRPGVTDTAFTTQPTPPDSAMPGFAFADDESVRPWLFGNWWRSRGGSGPLQLIGLGVRLGTGPHLLEAEGNHSISQYNSGERKANAFFWGTYLRIRAEDGALQLSITFASSLTYRYQPRQPSRRSCPAGSAPLTTTPTSASSGSKGGSAPATCTTGHRAAPGAC